MSESMAKKRQIKLYCDINVTQNVDTCSVDKVSTSVDNLDKVSRFWLLFRIILSFLRQKCTNVPLNVDTFDTSATPLRHPKCRHYYSMIPTVISHFHLPSTLFFIFLKKAQHRKNLSYSVEGIKRVYEN